MSEVRLLDIAEPILDGHGDVDRRVLNFVFESVAELGYPPTIREIQAACALRSISATQASIRRLEQQGVLRTRPRQARGLEVIGSLPEPALEDRMEMLCFFAAVGRVYWPHQCRAAGLAPSAHAAEEWLGLAVACLRQAEAIAAALARAQAVHGPVPAAVGIEVGRACERIEETLAATTTWVGWIALEQFDAEVILDRGVPTRTRPVQGRAATVLEGNLQTAALGRLVTAREIARLEASVLDPTGLRRELAEGRRRAAALYADLAEVLDRCWVPAG